VGYWPLHASGYKVRRVIPENRQPGLYPPKKAEKSGKKVAN
jgi:hypothetical protein